MLQGGGVSQGCFRVVEGLGVFQGGGASWGVAECLSKQPSWCSASQVRGRCRVP